MEQGSFHSFGKFFRIVRGNEETGLFIGDQFVGSTCRRGEYRCPQRHRLNEDIGDPVTVPVFRSTRGKNQKGRFLDAETDRFLRLPADKLDGFLQSETVAKLFKLTLQRTVSGNDAGKFPSPILKDSTGLEQGVDSFFRGETASGEESPFTQKGVKAKIVQAQSVMDDIDLVCRVSRFEYAAGGLMGTGDDPDCCPQASPDLAWGSREDIVRVDRTAPGDSQCSRRDSREVCRDSRKFRMDELAAHMAFLTSITAPLFL